MPPQVLGKYMDQIGKPYGPSPAQTLKETYLVPPEQVSPIIVCHNCLKCGISANRRDCLHLTEQVNPLDCSCHAVKALFWHLALGLHSKTRFLTLV